MSTDGKRGGRLRYRYRLVIGMLVVLLPVMIVSQVVLTAKASSSLTDASHAKTQGLAHALELRLEDWLAERRANLVVLAGQVGTDQLDADAVVVLVEGANAGYEDFEALTVTDLTGTVIGSTGSASVSPASSDWFRSVISGQPVVTSPAVRDGAVEWVMAEPLIGADGRIEGAVIGYLDVAVLSRLLNAELDEDTNALVVDSSGVLIYDTEMGEVADSAALLEAGGLTTTIDSPAIREAATNGGGTARYKDPEGHEVIGGSDIIDGLDWVLVAQEHTSSSLAPVSDMRRLSTIIGIVGPLLAIVATWIFARREAKKLASFADDTRVAGVEVNSAASELSAASDELAATTTQQSAAVTQASATTEELARASSVIADTVDEVARQAAETRDNLEQAESDIQVSSERTVVLAERVNDIGGLLALINEIADQTGLLALNAAIEAARAGEDGRGFAVVADEVRRLADNSKSSAGDIARIIDAVHAETNATVMAMEKGAKQMQQGLALLEHVTEATDQVRLTTQQQRSATAQVVETMEQLTDASRQVSITAQQIAGAAGNLAELAGNLDTTASAAKDRY